MDIYVHIYTYMYIRTYIHTYMDKHVLIHTHIYQAKISRTMEVCICHIYIYIYICIYYMYICMHGYICTNTHAHISGEIMADTRELRMSHTHTHICMDEHVLIHTYTPQAKILLTMEGCACHIRHSKRKLVVSDFMYVCMYVCIVQVHVCI